MRFVASAPSLERLKFVLLAPKGTDVHPAFHNVHYEASQYSEYLASMQRLRGRLYLEDGAIDPSELRAVHLAKSYAMHLRLSSHYEDETVPFIEHCFDAVVSEPEYLGADLPDDIKDGTVLGRLMVNEFPLHMITAARSSWFWLFDRCQRGTPEILGNMLDHLETQGTLDLQWNSGTLLHLQLIEVDPRFQRTGIGSALVNYAVGMLSRSNHDVAITAVADDTLAAFPRLISTEHAVRDAAGGKVGGRRLGHLPPEQVRDFWLSLGFTEWSPRWETLVELAQNFEVYGLQLTDQDAVPTGALWRKIGSRTRARLAQFA